MTVDHDQLRELADALLSEANRVDPISVSVSTTSARMIAEGCHALLAERKEADSVLTDDVEELGMTLLESRDRVRDVLAAVGVAIQQQMRLDQERIAELELELEQAEQLYRERYDWALHERDVAQTKAEQTIDCLLANVRPLMAELKVIIEERLLPPTSEAELKTRLEQADRTIARLKRDSDRQVEDWDSEAIELRSRLAKADARLAKLPKLLKAAQRVLDQSYTPDQGPARRELRVAVVAFDDPDQPE